MPLREGWLQQSLGMGGDITTLTTDRIQSEGDKDVTATQHMLLARLPPLQGRMQLEGSVKVLLQFDHTHCCTRLYPDLFTDAGRDAASLWSGSQRHAGQPRPPGALSG